MIVASQGSASRINLLFFFTSNTCSLLSSFTCQSGTSVLPSASGQACLVMVSRRYSPRKSVRVSSIPSVQSCSDSFKSNSANRHSFLPISSKSRIRPSYSARRRTLSLSWLESSGWLRIGITTMSRIELMANDLTRSSLFSW